MFKRNFQNNFEGFSLIELLVVISIIGVLVALSLFGLKGARESARDARRKADLELIRSALELYKADCGKYPENNEVAFGSPLRGTDTPTTCSSSNTYGVLPNDPQGPTSRFYRYNKVNDTSYQLCASLEQGGTVVYCGVQYACGDTPNVDDCNYIVLNP